MIKASPFPKCDTNTVWDINGDKIDRIDGSRIHIRMNTDVRSSNQTEQFQTFLIVNKIYMQNTEYRKIQIHSEDKILTGSETIH